MQPHSITPLADRFWSKVRKSDDSDACWEMFGDITPSMSPSSSPSLYRYFGWPFHAAIKELIFGSRITRQAWDNWDIYLTRDNGLVLVTPSEHVPYVLTDDDLTACDWQPM